jgi:hypothetical protein
MVDTKHPAPPKSELLYVVALAGLTSHPTPPRPFSTFLGEIQASWAFFRVEKISPRQITKPHQISRDAIFYLLPAVSRSGHRA